MAVLGLFEISRLAAMGLLVPHHGRREQLQPPREHVVRDLYSPESMLRFRGKLVLMNSLDW
jgi:hypothetical protein